MEIMHRYFEVGKMKLSKGWIIGGILMWFLIGTAVFLSVRCANNIVSWSYSEAEKKQALSTMDSVKINLHIIEDVTNLMKTFTYHKQTFLWNYTPKIETVFEEKLIGNCQFAAVLGKWGLECIGIPARLVSVYRDNDYHAIAVSEDNTIVISNNDLIVFPKFLNYKEMIMQWFVPAYTNWHEGILKDITKCLP